MTHKMTVYDIFVCRHTVQIYSLRSFSELLNAIRNLILYRGFCRRGILSYTLFHRSCRVAMTKGVNDYNSGLFIIKTFRTACSAAFCIHGNVKLRQKLDGIFLTHDVHV